MLKYIKESDNYIVEKLKSKPKQWLNKKKTETNSTSNDWISFNRRLSNSIFLCNIYMQ